MDVFFSDEDRHAYLELLAEQGQTDGVEYLAWCLMTNHVHLVAVPRSGDALGRTLRDTHQSYAAKFNLKIGESGHLNSTW